MPPKAAKADKSTQKKKEKIAEDKTFGLKNKNKSKKVQQYVQNVKKVVLNGGKTARQLELEKQEREAKKAAKKGALDDEMAQLFKAVVEKPKQEVRPDVDPKSQLCAYFKAGQCNRGNKCKFSHDLNIERKVDKINLYQDPREVDTMEKWDQKKLEEVVASKIKGPPPSNIICKYFLDAIEQQKYGWFWECPNGETCHYKHALPPGYVFKPKEEKKKDKEEEDDGPTLEERIEMQRAQLEVSKCTPVTLESFTKWKEVQAKKRAEEIEKKREAAAKAKGSKGYDVLSGRALFTYDPSLFVDDDDAVDDNAYEIVEAKSDDEQSDDGKADNGAQGGDESGDDNGDDDDNGGGDDDDNDDNDDDGDNDADKPAAAAADVAAVQDASLFLAEDVELPDDD